MKCFEILIKGELEERVINDLKNLLMKFYAEKYEKIVLRIYGKNKDICYIGKLRDILLNNFLISLEVYDYSEHELPTELRESGNKIILKSC